MSSYLDEVDQATCQSCGGRISYDRGWTHDWLSGDPPQPDWRVLPHPAWPYLHSSQTWRNRGRDAERPSVQPWDAPAFTAAHLGTRRERALAWLRESFAP